MTIPATVVDVSLKATLVTPTHVSTQGGRATGDDAVYHLPVIMGHRMLLEEVTPVLPQNVCQLESWWCRYRLTGR